MGQVKLKLKFVGAVLFLVFFTALSSSAAFGKVSLNVLFVIDNSGSMNEEQQKLLDMLPKLMSEKLDEFYTISVITTDCSMPQQEFIRTSHAEMADPTSFSFNRANTLWNTATKVGTSGHPDEKGLSTALNYFKRETIGNCRVLRALRSHPPRSMKEAVVFITDEDDGTLSDISAQDFEDLGFVLGENFRAFGLLNLGKASKSCATESNVSSRYINLIKKTQGYYANICESDYSSFFLALSRELKEFNDL